MTTDEIIEISGKRFIRLRTFAVEMGLHIRTVQLWVKEYDMPIIRVGNQMLLDLDELPQWLDQHKLKVLKTRLDQARHRQGVARRLYDLRR